MKAIKYLVLLICVILISCQNHEGGEGYDEYGVYIANADGSNPVKIRDDFDIGTQFTPDDQKIILGGSETSIRIMNIDGTDYQDIELHCNGVPFDFPSITNNGKKVFYSASPTKTYNSDIYFYDIETNTKINFTNTTSKHEFYPTISAQANQIAFTTLNQDSLGYTISVMNIDGTNRRVLISNSLHAYAELKFSQNGNGLFYTLWGSLYYLDLSNNKSNLILNTRGICPISFSLSGDKMVYSELGLISLVNLDTLEKRKITSGYSGTISQDGNYVIYQTGASYSDLNIIDLTTNQIRRVAQNAGFANFSNDGSKIVYIVYKTVYDKNMTE